MGEGDIDVLRTLADAFAEQQQGFVDQRQHGTLLYVFGIEGRGLVGLFRAVAGDDRGDVRIGDRSVVVVAVVALAGLAPQASCFAEQVRNTDIAPAIFIPRLVPLLFLLLNL